MHFFASNKQQGKQPAQALATDFAPPQTWTALSILVATHGFVHTGGEGAEICVTQVGARGVAVTTQRSAQPYEFAYDHVSGDLGSQEDLFMCKYTCQAPHSCEILRLLWTCKGSLGYSWSFS